MNLTPAHIHLMLNHIPVLGVPFAALLLAFGLWRKQKAYTQLALFLLIITALVSIPVFLSGDGAEDIVEKLPGVTEHIIEAHEEIAESGFYLALATGALALLTLLIGKIGLVARFGNPVVLLSAVVTSGVLLIAAMKGGEIRHTEIRESGDAHLTQAPS